jgi:hypothetical protein
MIEQQQTNIQQHLIQGLALTLVVGERKSSPQWKLSPYDFKGLCIW